MSQEIVLCMRYNKRPVVPWYHVLVFRVEAPDSWLVCFIEPCLYPFALSESTSYLQDDHVLLKLAAYSAHHTYHHPFEAPQTRGKVHL